jgi:hypothetical protein
MAVGSFRQEYLHFVLGLALASLRDANEAANLAIRGPCAGNAGPPAHVFVADQPGAKLLM